MYDVRDIASLQKSQNLNQDEIDICCMIANRFTDKDLTKASFKLDAYKRKDKVFPSKKIKDFIDEICNERQITIFNQFSY